MAIAHSYSIVSLLVLKLTRCSKVSIQKFVNDYRRVQKQIVLKLQVFMCSFTHKKI